jgi:integrase
VRCRTVNCAARDKRYEITERLLLSRTIRLEPGTTKNHDGREVTMTRRVYELLKLCVFGKTAESFVFNRSNGKAVRDFRGTWAKACKEAGVPGLLFHDLRRTAARNLRRAGVAEGVIMKIGGWRARSVFERYAIVSQADIAEALGRLELRGGHSLGHSDLPNRILTNRPRFDNCISPKGLRLVPGGGVEPPRY